MSKTKNEKRFVKKVSERSMERWEDNDRGKQQNDKDQIEIEENFEQEQE